MQETCYKITSLLVLVTNTEMAIIETSVSAPNNYCCNNMFFDNYSA